MIDVRAVLQHFPVVGPQTVVHALGDAGGFSGALLWRIENRQRQYCLRCWPVGGASSERLGFIHQQMTAARRSGLSFVPEVFPTRAGATYLQHQGRLWDLTGWLPGRADFHVQPSAVRLRAACAALARLHLAWSLAASDFCPAVRRRLEAVREWRALLDTGWQPPAGGEPLALLSVRAWRLLGAWLGRVPGWLGPWTTRRMPVQPCLCDVWHDHLLFEGEQLRGLVDYGAVKVDHVAVDVARLLGSLVGDDAEGWTEGLSAYRAWRNFSDDDETLARMLDRSGTVAALGTWLRRLHLERQSFGDPSAVVRRMTAVVERVERWR